MDPIFQWNYIPLKGLDWISSILNMTQHVSAIGADGEEVHNKFIVVYQQSKLSSSLV